MEYNEFKESLIEKLKSITGDDIEVECHQVLKNNSINLDAIILKKEGISASPNFYIDQIYEKFKNDEEKSITKICYEIINVFDNNAKNPKFEGTSLKYEDVKDKIVMRLVSKDKNEKLLSECPNVDFLDLSIIFYVVVEYRKEDMACLRVNNEILKAWDIPLKKLYKRAFKNTQKMFKGKVVRINDMLKASFNKHPGCPIEDEELKALLNDEEINMFVITNENNINGACMFLYDEVRDKLKEIFDNSFYILPSSIHEVIAVKKDSNDKIDELLQIVREINRTVVDKEEFLSDNIYEYNVETDSYSLICE
ncbi:MAG: DUF5688 family protein [Lachnospiraceae bacterium]|nr:DUF5688 family protein [Lachnospiraceae bacterium]